MCQLNRDNMNNQYNVIAEAKNRFISLLSSQTQVSQLIKLCIICANNLFSLSLSNKCSLVNRVIRWNSTQALLNHIHGRSLHVCHTHIISGSRFVLLLVQVVRTAVDRIFFSAVAKHQQSFYLSIKRIFEAS